MFSRQVNHWLKRRLPAANTIALTNRRLFIFPTRAGFVWLAMLILCWLVATNYENNVVFALGCLLTSVFVVSIFATYANLSRVSVRWVKMSPVFAGETAQVELLISHTGKRERIAILLAFPGEDGVTLSLRSQESVPVSVPVKTWQRGWFDPGWLIIESVYPLGLLRVWSRLDLDIRGLVYPAPSRARKTESVSAGSGNGELAMVEGSEDFRGLEDYRLGDSLKRVAWKPFARGQGMYVKHYGDYASQDYWLAWESYPGLDTEMRLSCLCGELLDIESAHQAEQYGLKLPSVEIAPGHDDVHRQRVLRELALFGFNGHSQVKP